MMGIEPKKSSFAQICASFHWYFSYQDRSKLIKALKCNRLHHESVIMKEIKREKTLPRSSRVCRPVVQDIVKNYHRMHSRNGKFRQSRSCIFTCKSLVRFPFHHKGFGGTFAKKSAFLRFRPPQSYQRRTSRFAAFLRP